MNELEQIEQALAEARERAEGLAAMGSLALAFQGVRRLSGAPEWKSAPDLER